MHPFAGGSLHAAASGFTSYKVMEKNEEPVATSALLFSPPP